MSQSDWDVVGIGNAIVDIIARCDDAFLAERGLSKGHMELIDAEAAEALYDAMGPAVEISGGSVANTCAGVASLGGSSGFIGRVAQDQFGDVFARDIRSIGVTYDTPPAQDGAPTARSLILVTDDGERTMNTFLGASVELGEAEIEPAMIAGAKITYLEGYLFDPPKAQAAFHEAARMAAEAEREIALSLSDAFCVDRHRAAFRALIQGGVELLFANEDEITALYEVDTFSEAVEAVRAECRTAALTRGPKGSVIVTPEALVEISVEPVEKLVDTTGAGDLYAAGFLFGHAQGLESAICGQLGSLAAAEVIGHLGARPETPLVDLAKKKGLIS